MNCPKCKARVPSDAAFCPECGTNPKAFDATKAVTGGPTGDKWSGLTTIGQLEHERPSLEPGTRFADRYDIVRKLGEGGMGVVYVAKDTNTGEELVLKLIHPELVTGEQAIKALLAEGLTARQIRHPNIVAVYDVAQWNGQPYFSMEFVRGGTLRAWMTDHSGKDVPLPTAAGLIDAILEGMSEAHRCGIVHRDLKPENVMLAGDPAAGDFSLKILDFGIAKALSVKTGSGGGTGRPIGTPPYMAPEQQTSADTVGPQADLFALSVMFYELLMGAAPLRGWESVSKDRRDVPSAVDALLEKGLKARPRSRQASVEEYQSELRAALQGVTPGPDPIRPEPVRPEPKRPDPRRPEPVTPAGPGFFANMSAKTKAWVAGIGAVFVIAAAQQNCPQPPNNGGGGGNTSSLTFDGYWTSHTGNRFEVDWDSSSFEATGALPQYGQVSMTGMVSHPAGAQFTFKSQRGDELGGSCASSISSNQFHLDCQLADSTRIGFAVNHAWH